MNATAPSTNIADVWSAWSPMAGVIGGFATGAAAVFAAGALWYARHQLRAGSVVAREQTAQQCYTDYLRLCIEYPTLTNSELAVTTLPSKSLTGLGDQNTAESEKYCWFISYMLAACEKILASCPGDEGWRACVVSQVRYHAPALKQLWANSEKHYTEELGAIVNQEIVRLEAENKNVRHKAHA